MRKNNPFSLINIWVSGLFYSLKTLISRSLIFFFCFVFFLLIIPQDISGCPDDEDYFLNCFIHSNKTSRVLFTLAMQLPGPSLPFAVR